MPPIIDRPERLQVSVNCVHVYPPDEETDLQNYLSPLPDEDDAFKPMELTEIVPKAMTPNNDFLSDPPFLTLQECQQFHDLKNPFTLDSSPKNSSNLLPEDYDQVFHTPPPSIFWSHSQYNGKAGTVEITCRSRGSPMFVPW